MGAQSLIDLAILDPSDKFGEIAVLGQCIRDVLVEVDRVREDYANIAAAIACNAHVSNERDILTLVCRVAATDAFFSLATGVGLKGVDGHLSDQQAEQPALPTTG